MERSTRIDPAVAMTKCPSNCLCMYAGLSMCSDAKVTSHVSPRTVNPTPTARRLSWYYSEIFWRWTMERGSRNLSEIRFTARRVKHDVSESVSSRAEIGVADRVGPLPKISKQHTRVKARWPRRSLDPPVSCFWNSASLIYLLLLSPSGHCGGHRSGVHRKYHYAAGSWLLNKDRISILPVRTCCRVSELLRRTTSTVPRLGLPRHRAEMNVTRRCFVLRSSGPVVRIHR